jgi:hypothetical protein
MRPRPGGGSEFGFSLPVLDPSIEFDGVHDADDAHLGAHANGHHSAGGITAAPPPSHEQSETGGVALGG